MTKPSFFDRTVTIRTQEQMRERLAMRTNHGTGKLDPARNPDTDGGLADSKAGADPVRTLPLEWMPPVKATQNTVCGLYEIRGARLKDLLLYYSWSMREGPKLLGYPSTPEAARELCQKHADRQ